MIVMLLDEFKTFTERPEMELAPKKVFIQSHSEIPLLLDYSGDAPESWWSHWPTLTWEEGRDIKSTINPVKLVTWARRAGHPDMDTVLDIAKDLRVGCDLGTRGEHLCPSTSSNAPSAFEFGGQITDSIVSGIKAGIMMGPMEKSEIPFSSVKVNGMLAVLKENGGVRICMNLSKGYPFCANEGQFNDERFEVRMSATRDWLISLNSAGQGCWFCKMDWSGAYKQLRTMASDVRQQFFKWMGKYFAELCLTFGGSSSVGLFDRLAKVFRFIATKLSKIPAKQVRQIIDDVVGCGTKAEVLDFYGKYKEVALDCGVILASEDDPKKAFSAAQEGEVFGVTYNSREFTWWLREDKQAVIVHMLGLLEQTGEHKLSFLKRIVGKLVHYRLMVPNGKFYLGQLVKVSQGEDLEEVVRVTDWARAEAWYWRHVMPFCGQRTRLPDPEYCLPPWTLRAHTDAAGGSRQHCGYGAGAVLGEEWWCYLPWGDWINQGRLHADGKRLDCKMSAWELVGPLMILTAGVELVKGRSLVVPVDNQDLVSIFQKGWCSGCSLATTLALAISEVAASIDCKLEIVKIKRCGNVPASAADAVSKADWARFRRLMPGASAAPAVVPQALVSWVHSPVADRNLGQKILGQMGRVRTILGHRDNFM